MKQLSKILFFSSFFLSASAFAAIPYKPVIFKFDVSGMPAMQDPSGVLGGALLYYAGHLDSPKHSGLSFDTQRNLLVNPVVQLTDGGNIISGVTLTGTDIQGTTTSGMVVTDRDAPAGFTQPTKKLCNLSGNYTPGVYNIKVSVEPFYNKETKGLVGYYVHCPIQKQS